MPKVPKQSIRRSLSKRHKNIRINDTAITAVYLDYVLFVKRLTQKAEEIAILNKEPIVNVDHFREAAKVVLREFRA